jgi:hypothetical protein
VAPFSGRAIPRMGLVVCLCLICGKKHSASGPIRFYSSGTNISVIKSGLHNLKDYRIVEPRAMVLKNVLIYNFIDLYEWENVRLLNKNWGI